MPGLGLAILWWAGCTIAWFSNGHTGQEILTGWWKVAFFAPWACGLAWAMYELFTGIRWRWKRSDRKP